MSKRANQQHAVSKTSEQPGADTTRQSTGDKDAAGRPAPPLVSHDFSTMPVFPQKNTAENKNESSAVYLRHQNEKETPLSTHIQNAEGSSFENLSAGIRGPLQNFLSTDLSSVRVHDNPASHRASEKINALAYTTQNHIFLGKEVSSFSPLHKKNLIAHEVVHTLQQKSLPASAANKPVVGKPDTKYEQEANTIAGAFTGAEKMQFKSSALQMRSNMRISSLAGAEIQRTEKTWGGEWDTLQYNKITPAKAGGLRGAHIELEFKPGNVVDAELIGLVQTAKAINRGKVTYIGDKTRKAHGISKTDATEIDSVTKETDEGTHVDQMGYNRNPVYAVEGAPNTDKELSDTLPVAGDATKTSGFGRHGFHFKDATGKLKDQSALLNDTPRQTNVAKNSSNIFEVTALAIKGKQQGTYYGSVQWGWRTDAAGAFDLIPLKSVSQGTPTPSFMKAAELWNAGKTSKKKDTLDLPIPIPVFSGPFDEILDISPRARVERGARIKVIRTDITDAFIEVLSGPSTGVRGYINIIGGNPFTNIEK